MPMEKRFGRRAFLQTSSLIATSGLAACNENQDAGDITFDGGSTEFGDALNRLELNGGRTLNIEPGTYHLEPTEKSDGVGPPFAHFEPSLLDDVTIEGNGAKLLFTDPLMGGLHFNGGQNLTLHNLTLDYEPLPYTQGEIIDIPDGFGKVILKLDDGYPPLTHDMFELQQGLDVWGSIHSATGDLITGVRAGDRPQDKRIATFKPVSDRVYELTFLWGRGPIKIGNRLAIVARGGRRHVINIKDVDQPVIENVLIHTSPEMVIRFIQCTDPVVRNVSLKPPSDSNRLIASNADGIHFVNCRSGPLVEDCETNRLLDDAIALSAKMPEIIGIIDDETIRLNSVFGPHFEEDDVLEAMSPNGVRTGPLPGIASVQSYSRGRYTSQPPERVKFEAPVSHLVEIGDFVSNRSSSNRGFIIRNNVLTEHRARLIRISGGTGTIEQNRLDGCQWPAIMLNCDTRGAFAPFRWVEDVVVRNNVISRPGMVYFALNDPSGIAVWHQTHPEHDNEGRPNRDITIIGNQIGNAAFRGLTIRDAENVHVEDNEMADLNQLDYPPPDLGVYLDNVSGATLIENTVKGTSEELDIFGGQRNSEGISERDNTLIIDGRSIPGELKDFD